jgi:predicted esterase
MLSKLQQASYCSADLFNRWDVADSFTSWPEVDSNKVRYIIKDNGAACGVGRLINPDGCFVAIRGTVGMSGVLFDSMFWMSDFKRDSCPGCQGETGFLAYYDALKDDILTSLDEFGCKAKPLYLVGHSMGAAILAFLLYDALEAGYTIKHAYGMESPRPGNAAFSAALQSKLSGIDAWRISHFKDRVVHLPPQVISFRHALREIYYIHSDGREHRECGIESRNCSNQWHWWQYHMRYHAWFVGANPCECQKSGSKIQELPVKRQLLNSTILM